MSDSAQSTHPILPSFLPFESSHKIWIPMDVVGQYFSDFNLNCHSKSVQNRNRVSAYIPDLPSGSSTTVDDTEKDHSDEILKFISQMLMEEEDLENKPCMLQDSLALQAAEKCLFDVLNGKSPCSSDCFVLNPNPVSSESSSDSIESISWLNQGEFDSSIQYSSLSNLNSFGTTDSVLSATDLDPSETDSLSMVKNGENKRKNWSYSEEHRITKQMATNGGIDSEEPLEMYDKVLLCPPVEIEAVKSFTTSNRRRGGKRRDLPKQVVDLRGLLMQCAQALASNETRTVNELLAKISQHSSPHGDETERLSHYFAKALEARLAGTGTASYTAFGSSRISASEMLKSYHTSIMACPYKRMSNYFANKSIRKLASGATRLHIIDFGILYGFQWPCLIKALSERPGGPPKLRITGIDFPQPGFRPAGRVEETGSRLKKYCKRFNVPFEFDAIASKWENVRIEQLKIDKNELLIVNSLFRLHNVPDETVNANSRRDALLKLIKMINPDMYIEGVVNGTYNTPFFVTRFREAIFHFASMFDMLEATLPRDDPDRKLYEKEYFGKDILNIIACEGSERVDRPETYKQWQARNVRAGFKQLPLDQEIVAHIKKKVKLNYHKDFSVDEDGSWMLQGWKGRVLYALSCWRP